LAERRQIQLRCLAAILELRIYAACQAATPQQETQRNPTQFAHGRTFLPIGQTSNRLIVFPETATPLLLA
jgi:hypothetical protein